MIDKEKEKRRLYYIKNRHNILKKRKEYQIKNREKLLLYWKKYWADHREERRLYRIKTKKHRQEYGKLYREKNKKILSEQNKKYKKEHPLSPEKKKVYKSVLRAIKNKTLVRPKKCSVCKKINKRIEAHHNDYSKPLDVVWVCPICHRVLDERKRNKK